MCITVDILYKIFNNNNNNNVFILFGEEMLMLSTAIGNDSI